MWCRAQVSFLQSAQQKVIVLMPNAEKFQWLIVLMMNAERIPADVSFKMGQALASGPFLFFQLYYPPFLCVNNILHLNKRFPMLMQTMLICV